MLREGNADGRIAQNGAYSDGCARPVQPTLIRQFPVRQTHDQAGAAGVVKAVTGLEVTTFVSIRGVGQ